MRYFVLFLTFSIIISCENESNKKNDLILDSGFTEEVVGRENVEMVNARLQCYVDSSVNYDCNDLPRFLFDKNFDLLDTIILNAYAHESLKPNIYSLRAGYFKKLEDKKLLNVY